MKAARFLVMLLLLGVLIAAVPVVAQQQGEENDDMQAVTVYAQRVYPHRLGWVVIYNRSDLYPGEVYLPVRWFTEAGARGQIIYSNHPSVPYLTVFYRNGQFDFVRLYVSSNTAHRSWGSLPGGRDYDSFFESDTINIQY